MSDGTPKWADLYGIDPDWPVSDTERENHVLRRILHRPDRGTAGHRRRETGGDAQRTARQKALIEASMTPYAYDMRKWWPACHLYQPRAGVGGDE